MKTEIITKEKPKEFEPFVLQMTVESLDEAKVIWSVFNSCSKFSYESFGVIDDFLIARGYDEKTLELTGDTTLSEL